jgi:hypothetical protein
MRQTHGFTGQPAVSKVPTLDDPLRKTVTTLASLGRAEDAARLLVPFLNPKRNRWTSEDALHLATDLAKRRKAWTILLPAVLPLLTKLLWPLRATRPALRQIEASKGGTISSLDRPYPA